MKENWLSLEGMLALISIVIAALCAQPLLGNLESAFQYIQNFTGFFTWNFSDLSCSFVLEKGH